MANDLGGKRAVAGMNCGGGTSYIGEMRRLENNITMAKVHMNTAQNDYMDGENDTGHAVLNYR